MRSYQEGNFEAFEELYDRYSGRVFGYLNGKLRASAEDAHQEVFLKLHNSRSHYNSEFKFAGWIFTIARTVMIDQMRKQEKYSSEIGHDNLEQFASVDSANASVDLSHLSQNESRVLEMRYQQGLDFEAIAKELETTSTSIRQQVSRAVRHLRRFVGVK